MDPLQQVRELNSLSEEEIQAQVKQLGTLHLPKAVAADRAPTMEEVLEAREKAFRLFEPIGAAVGITEVDGQLAISVNLQHIPSDITIPVIQKMIEEHKEIDNVPIDYQVTGITKAH